METRAAQRELHPGDVMLAILEVWETAQRGQDAVLAKLLLREEEIRVTHQTNVRLAREVEAAALQTERTREYARRQVQRHANQVRRYATFLRRHLPRERARQVLDLDRQAGVDPPTMLDEHVDLASVLREAEPERVAVRGRANPA